MRNFGRFSSHWTAWPRELIRLPGVAMVQSITRAAGPTAGSRQTFPYLFTAQGSSAGQQLPFNQQQKRRY